MSPETEHLGPPPGAFVPMVQISQPQPWPGTQFVGCVVRIAGREDMVCAGTTAAEAVAIAVRTLGDVLEHHPDWLDPTSEGFPAAGTPQPVSNDLGGILPEIETVVEDSYTRLAALADSTTEALGELNTNLELISKRIVQARRALGGSED